MKLPLPALIVSGWKRTRSTSRSSRDAVADTAGKLIQVVPPSTEYCQKPFVVAGILVIAMPFCAPAVSVTVPRNDPIVWPALFTESSVMGFRVGAKTVNAGAVFAELMFSVSVLAVGSRSIPPFAVPPVSWTLNRIVRVALAAADV